MIIDLIENWRDCVCLLPGLEAGFRFIAETFSASMGDGRYELPDGQGYVNLESYRTLPAAERRFEAHRKYADIQVVASGEEMIEWLPVSMLDVEEAHSEDRDAGFYRGAGDATRLHLVPGCFVVFFPGDGHKPGCCVAGPMDVRKIVAKVRL
ncbi:MAG: DUF386 domain-containing protein [Planctomycetes bacterium]|nr:DUF386 domain-containing protein [Planctomycetota bacterium]